MNNSRANTPEFDESSITPATILFMLLAVAVGTMLAAILMPGWLPNLATSLVGEAPKGYWYLSRGSAFVAMVLLWLSMAMGTIITNKLARLWPGGPPAFAIHEFASLLGLVVALFHAMVLIGDRYIAYTVPQVLMPFASLNYRPTWVGLGQIGFYLWLVVSFTFYIRRQLGNRAWRLIHFASYISYILALIHGLTSGTDSSTLWVQVFYWFNGGSLLFLFIYRLLISTVSSSSGARATPTPQTNNPAPLANQNPGAAGG
jgi:predicted ferric reductase